MALMHFSTWLSEINLIEKPFKKTMNFKNSNFRFIISNDIDDEVEVLLDDDDDALTDRLMH